MEQQHSLAGSLQQATIPIEQSGISSAVLPARYLLLSAQNGLSSLSGLIRQQLADGTAIRWNLSEMEGDPAVFILTLPGRQFFEAGPAFQGAYALLDRIELEAAEPDYPTDVYASPRDSAEGLHGFEPESADSAFWCWEDIEQELDGRRRWALEETGLPDAWDIARDRSRGKGIIVAQPDTGVTEHHLLKGRPGPNLAGWDFIERQVGAMEPVRREGDTSHGTGTASVAVGAEHQDMAGAAPLATHLPIRAIRSVVRITQGTVAEAIHYAIEKGAHVISMSLGGVPSFALHRAIADAVAKDIIIVAAAGNCVGFAVWPARFKECIGVAAVNQHGKRWKGSSHGKSVDIAAPGQNVFRAQTVSTGANLKYTCGQGQGTSFATALTAGAAACWLAHHGRETVIAAAKAQGMTVQQLFLKLAQASARKPGWWPQGELGDGILDAGKLLGLPLQSVEETESTPIQEEDYSVQSLVYEAAGGESVAEPDLDRYGAEISLAILESAKRAPQRDGDGGVEPETTHQDHALPLSPDLAAVLKDNPVLEQAIRFPNGRRD